MSVAIIQGASGGQGLALASHLLRHTGLRVYALSRGKAKVLEEKLAAESGEGTGSRSGGERLSVIGGVDIREEDGLQKAAKTVREREGKSSVRLVACMAGIVRAYDRIDGRNASIEPF
jgi:NAD(P)-dependent dehydrogenase (short-subunit alcohol dehydrogenase family)